MHCYPYWGMPDMYMDFYEDHSGLTDMYPDVYRRVYPRVREICHHMDVPTNPRMYPQVDPRMIEEMVGQIYEMEMSQPYAQQFRGVFRDLITILVLRELIGRRRRYPRRGYGPGVGYGPIGGYPGFF
ncbi:hypothetical protein [Alkaliphilus peptidifermentans]|uniref:Uncharacterized protein n=1 Tax=Alkaliphilus peptidifermentans DSM 18978 TaxID=1120976 RepID=A0A1G5AML1_9FIRM|nr:hypothetical protein [Alkaliphilus peptidifermentans]SCX79121.1 hypothetical protein SAMN03080606_00209 [Alkaliphilus peptidifermentans DSM 18978]